MSSRISVCVLCLVLASGLARAGDRMGVVHVLNRDGAGHSIEIDWNQRVIHVFFGMETGPDIHPIPPGGTATTQLAPGPWRVFGDGEERFAVMINADREYDFTLQPFSQTGAYGEVGYGLLGLFDDGYNQSSYQLFSLDAAPPPPAVVVQPAPMPPTPPVVVVPSPSYYYPPPERHDDGRALGEAIGSAVFNILGEVLSNDRRDHHRPSRPRPRR